MTLTDAEQRFLARLPRCHEVTEASMEGAHFLEIRGIAEAVTSGPVPTDGHAGAEASLAAEFIRIHPRRVIAFNVDPDRPGLQTRDVAGVGAQPNVA